MMDKTFFIVRNLYVGHSWKIIPTIKRNPDISRMIVVAIDNDGLGRMNEYAAWKYQESNIPGLQFGGKGVEYAEFVMDVVKPFIDETTVLSLTVNTQLWLDHLSVVISPSLWGLDYKEQIGCLGSFLQLTGFIKMLLIVISREKARFLISVSSYMLELEEADDTDKTLMAGNIKQAYIDSSLELLS